MSKTYTIKEAAQITGKSPRTIRRYMKKGLLKGRKTKTGEFRINANTFLNNQLSQPTAFNPAPTNSPRPRFRLITVSRAVQTDERVTNRRRCSHFVDTFTAARMLNKTQRQIRYMIDKGNFDIAYTSGGRHFLYLDQVQSNATRNLPGTPAEWLV